MISLTAAWNLGQSSQNTPLQAFSSNVSITVSTSTFPTQLIGGQIILSFTNKENHIISSGPCDVRSNGDGVAAALLGIDGVTSASAIRESCSREGACSWSLFIQYVNGRLPPLIVQTADLIGSNAIATISRLREGTAVTTGSFQVLVSAPSLPVVVSTSLMALPLNEQAFQNSLHQALGNFQFKVTKHVDVGVINLATRYSIEIASSVPALAESVLSSNGTLLAFADASALPSLQLGKSRLHGTRPLMKITEKTAEIFNKYSRYLLTIDAPPVVEVPAVQQIICGKVDNATFLPNASVTFSLRGFTTPAVPLFEPSDLKSSLESLLSVKQIALSSNSTSGALCPVVPGVIFSTNVSFLSSTAASLGPIPFLLPSTAFSSVDVQVVPVFVGAAASVSEEQLIQLLSPQTETEYTSLLLTLIYSGRKASISITATAKQWSSTLTTLTQSKEGFIVSTEGLTLFQWRIIFPLSFGPAQLIVVSTACGASSDESTPIVGQDSWQGVICGTNISASTRRLIAGVSALTGSFTLTATGSSGSIAVPVNISPYGLESLLNSQLSDFYGVTVTNLLSTNTSAISAYVISTGVEIVLQIDSGNILLGTPACTQTEHACVFPFEYQGALYTSCATVFGATPICALTYNLTQDDAWAACVSCYATNLSVNKWLQLMPLRTSLQLQGSAQDLASSLAYLVYVPESSSSTRSSASISSSVVSVLAIDASSDITLVSEFILDVSSPAREPFSLENYQSALVAFEDLPLLVDTLQVSCSFCVGTDLVIALVSVDYGQIAFLSDEGLTLRVAESGMKISAMGSLGAMSFALKSLVYRAPPNVNSNTLSRGVVDPVYRLDVSIPYDFMYQISFGTNPIMNTSLELAFSCLDGGPQLLFNLTTSMSAADVQLSMTSLIADCYHLSSNTSFIGNLDGLFWAGLAPIIPNNSVAFYTFRFAHPLIVDAYPLISLLNDSDGDVFLERVPSLLNETYRVSFNKIQSSEMSTSASAAEMQSILLAMPNVNDVRVTKMESLFEAFTVSSYMITFPLDSPWPVNVQDLSLYSSQTQSLVYGQALSTAINISLLVRSTVHLVLEREGSAGLDRLNVTLINVGEGDMSSSFITALYVLPVLDAPYLDTTGQDNLQVVEDTELLIEGLAITTIEQTPIVDVTVTLTSPRATITLPLLRFHDLSVQSSPTRTMFSGNFEAAQAVLSILVFTPELNYYGETYLYFEVLTSLGVTFSRITVSVLAVPEKIVVQLSTTHLVTERNRFAMLSCISLFDPDDLSRLDRVSMSISTTGGSFMVPTLQYINADSFAPVSFSQVSTFLFTGRVTDANSILRFLQFLADTNLSYADLSILVRREESSGEYSTGRIRVNVIDNAGVFIPIIFPSSELRILEDATWTVGQTVKFDIPSDVKCILDVLFSCDSGMLQAGVSIGATVHLSGTLQEVSSAMSEIRYTPSNNFHGSVRMTLSVVRDAIGGVPAASSAEFYIIVQSVYDPPAIRLRAQSTFALITQSTILNLFEVIAVEEELLIVELECDKGKLTLNPPLTSNVVLGDFRTQNSIAPGNSSSMSGYIGFATDASAVNRLMELLYFHLPYNTSGNLLVRISLRSTGLQQLTTSLSSTIVVRAPTYLNLSCHSNAQFLEFASVSMHQLCVLDVFTSPTDFISSATILLTASTGNFSINESMNSAYLLQLLSFRNNSFGVRSRLVHLRDTMASIALQLPPVFNGVLKLAVVLKAETLTTGSIYLTADVLLDILPVNSLPVITAVNTSTGLSILSNTTLTMSFFTIHDADVSEAEYGYLDMVLVAKLGRLKTSSQGDFTSMHVLLRDQGDGLLNGVRLMGSEMNLNAVIMEDMVWYEALQNISGSYVDEISVTVCDNGFTGIPVNNSTNCTTSVFFLSVAFVMVAPSLTSPLMIYGNEDADVNIGSYLELNANTFPLHTFLTLSMQSTVGAFALESIDTFTSEVSITAPLFRLQRILKTLVFRPLKVVLYIEYLFSTYMCPIEL